MRPSYAEVMDAPADRMALVRGILDDLTDSDWTAMPPLPRSRLPAPAPSLAVVIEEESEHHRFAVRDLAMSRVTSAAQRGSGLAPRGYR